MEQLDFIQNKLAPELRQMNEIIGRKLDTRNKMMNQIVTTYLKIKGKQIRPIMVLLSAKIFGGVNSHVLHAGAALEMLHNASLIHDDIVDETRLRRGVETINAAWGNHIAVLVGDFFVSNALACGIATGNIDIISSLSSLGKELSLGEINQICNVREHHFDEESYYGMISQKTASLFVNCVRMGSEAAGAKPEQYTPLMNFAQLLGLCFQIKDDIFDYFDDESIGKPTGNDLREGKVTLPLLYAINHAGTAKGNEIKALISRGNLTSDEIRQCILFAIEEGGIEYAYESMRRMQKEACSILAAYPESEWTDALLSIFDYIICRDR